MFAAPAPLFASDRRFQVWFYTVSHGTLLLRSPPDEAHATQVDVVFANVGHLRLATTLNGLEVSRGGAGDLGGEMRTAQGRTIFRVRSRGDDGQPGAIVAGSFRFHEWDGAHGDRSPLVPAFLQP